MARTTFSGPVRSLRGFLATGPAMATGELPAGTTDGGTDIAGIDLYQGKVITLGNNTCVFNLPSIIDTATPAAAGADDPSSTNRVGLYYQFLVSTNLSGNTFTLNAGAAAGRSTNDLFYGTAFYNNTATDPGVVTAFNAGGTDTLTLNGSTQGGLQGSYIQCRAADGLVWQVDCMLVGNGTFAQPWS